MQHDPNQSYLALANDFSLACQAQVAPLKSFTHDLTSLFNKAVSEYLDGLFAEYIGLAEEFSSLRSTNLAKDPLFFEEMWLGINDSDFSIDVSEFDFRSAFILYDVLCSNRTELNQIHSVSIFSNYRNKLIFNVEIGEGDGRIGGIDYNVTDRALKFHNERDSKNLYLPIADGCLDKKLIDSLSHGDYLFENIVRFDELMAHKDSADPSFVVAQLGSFDDYCDLLVNGIAIAMMNPDFDFSHLSALFQSERFAEFRRDTVKQAKYNIIGWTHPDDFEAFLSALYSLSTRNTFMPILDFFEADMIQHWLDRSGIFDNEQVLLKHLVTLDSFPDRGYFTEDRIPLMVENYEKVKDYKDCLKLSESLEEAIQNIGSVGDAVLDDNTLESHFDNSL
ncbi:hypothetical protein [Shewanella aestuarii]|uniref:Uncharacterized protein n=1 Tax=Shewanella aestuarii TaxID=1028752 RepID=A0A6G9QPT2_9GAMM|nr:hypothetical protein [Shewanella aestuarii]QIR16600.1 hypothetical protein HBH39_19180 [Shewanella aestuarii]